MKENIPSKTTTLKLRNPAHDPQSSVYPKKETIIDRALQLIPLGFHDISRPTRTVQSGKVLTMLCVPTRYEQAASLEKGSAVPPLESRLDPHRLDHYLFKDAQRGGR